MADLEAGAILATISDALYVLDAEWRFAYVNDEAARLLGRPPGELVGEDFWSLFPEATLDALGPLYRRARETGEPITATYYDEPLATWFEGRAKAQPDGTLVVSFRDVSDLRRLAEEHEAMRAIATVVARQGPVERLLGEVAGHMGRLVDAHVCGVLRLDDDGALRVAGGWNVRGGERPAGTTVPWSTDAARRAVLERREPWRVDDPEGAGSSAQAFGAHCTVTVPVVVGDRVWGTISAAHADAYGLRPDAAARLTDAAALVAVAVTNAEDRARLAERATTDPLTGLADHRAFHERLRDEVARAIRHGRPLSVALLDVDAFKEINDTAGHEVGDAVLVALAGRLREAARDEDVLGRIGGDEFAVLLPETDGPDAVVALDRMREAVSGEPFERDVHATASAGVCDLSRAVDADELLRLADAALYWSKAHGRDTTSLFDPAVVVDLSAEERARRLLRSQALTGIRALARAIDAKDPSTLRHSERVASLAARMASAAGWAPERVARLRGAALVHDVGKIGVADAVLLKPGALDDAEHEAVRRHAELGAEIAAEVLDDEQVAWIRGHHERPDGRGYPDGLRGDQIADGAAIMAIADAWDVMTSPRPYSAPRPPDEALAECRGLAGAQFTAEAVALLQAVVAGSAPWPTSASA